MRSRVHSSFYGEWQCVSHVTCGSWLWVQNKCLVKMNLMSKQLSNERVLNVIIHIVTCTIYQRPQPAIARFDILETLVFYSCHVCRTLEFCLLCMCKTEQTPPSSLLSKCNQRCHSHNNMFMILLFATTINVLWWTITVSKYWMDFYSLIVWHFWVIATNYGV